MRNISGRSCTENQYTRAICSVFLTILPFMR